MVWYRCIERARASRLRRRFDPILCETAGLSAASAMAGRRTAMRTPAQSDVELQFTPRCFCFGGVKVMVMVMVMVMIVNCSAVG